jgi:peptidoglycan/LPS O-acetylase OafA/YrhL
MPAQAAKLKLNTLELGRFIAATVVVLYHEVPDVNAQAAPGAALVFGGHQAPGPFAVAFFFVLSGFVMASNHGRDFGQVTGMLRFWWRRACRIYPIYWLALLIPLYYFLHSLVTPQNATSLFLLSPFAADNLTPADLISPAWSLHYELAFYLMFGLCMLPYIGKPLLAIWVGAVVWRWMPLAGLGLGFLPSPFIFYLWHMTLDGRVDRFTDALNFYFLCGLLVGWLFGRWRAGAPANASLVAVGLLGLGVLLPFVNDGLSYGTPMQNLVGGGFLGMIILGLAGLERAGVIRLGRWAAWAGMVSYPLYVLHAPLGLVAATHNPHWALSTPRLYGLLVAALTVVFGLSTIATLVFDQPVQRGLRRLTARAGAHRRQPSPI